MPELSLQAGRNACTLQKPTEPKGKPARHRLPLVVVPAIDQQIGDHKGLRSEDVLSWWDWPIYDLNDDLKLWWSQFMINLIGKERRNLKFRLCGRHFPLSLRHLILSLDPSGWSSWSFWSSQSMHFETSRIETDFGEEHFLKNEIYRPHIELCQIKRLALSFILSLIPPN